MIIITTVILNPDIKRSSGIYTASKQRKARTKTRELNSLCLAISIHYAIPPTAMSDMCQ